MTPSLILYSNNGQIALTNYMDVEEGRGMEPGDPTFTEKVFGRSLLKQGATLALENLKEKELIYPLKLKAVAEDLENLIRNPSFEYGNTTWTNGALKFLTNGASNSNEEKEPFIGEFVMKISAAGINQGSECAIPGVFKEATAYTASIYLKGNAGGEKILIKFGDVADYAETEVTLTTGWQRFSVSWTPGSELQDVGLAVMAKSGTPKWLMDATQVSQNAAAIPYTDGDQPGSIWIGNPGNSTSRNFAGKTGLAELIQRINMIINTPGTYVEWKDEGATNATFFDLISGQFDDEFDYRLGQNNWLKGKLRLFCQPFGRKTKEAIVEAITERAVGATNQATAPIIHWQAANPLTGDAPALLQGTLEAKTDNVGTRSLALSILPNASYVPWVPTPSTATVWNNGASEGWQYITSGNTGASPLNISREKEIYTGENRILVFARPLNNATTPIIQVTCLNNEYTFYTATAPVSAASQQQPWSVVDLGVVSVPSNTLIWSVKLAVVGNATSSILGLAMLPDSNTTFVRYKSTSGSITNYVFDGVKNVITGGNGKLTGAARGVIPQIPASATGAHFAALIITPSPKPSLNGLTISVLPRCRYVF